MKLAIVANDKLKEEMKILPVQVTELAWLYSYSEITEHQNADAVIDLLFENGPGEISSLSQFLPKLVIVNSVIKTIKEINFPFIRINGWPTFLNREIIEASCNNERTKKAGELVFYALGRKTEWVPDISGMISPRVVAMIINEAYFALEDKVSTKEEIDIAMKLGTNYPYGPFEWAGKIGLKKILDLLTKLSKTENRYQPAPLLIQEATSN